jgi:hypothetical protein
MGIEQRGGVFYGDGIHYSGRFPSRTPCGKADVPATNDWDLVGCEKCLEKRPKEPLRQPPPAPPRRAQSKR